MKMNMPMFDSESHARPKVWPVIHLGTHRQAMDNALIANTCGCEGVFVISMDGRDAEVIPVARAIKERFPELKVGINLLGSGADEALALSVQAGLDATWTDTPGVGSEGSKELGLRLQKALIQAPAHLFFGSVAFKYQKHEDNPGVAAQNAWALGMIPTTSGEATGQAPSVEKLSVMKTAVGSGPLGVASGIDPSNIGELGQHVSHILVSTGISKSFHEFDAQLLGRLMAQRPVLARAHP
jgi:hypothetical protein